MTAPLLLSGGVDAYREHFHQNYCAAPVTLVHSDGPIQVFFDRASFDHAFFESTNRDGSKDEFSMSRAVRMPQIAEMLGGGWSALHAGWNKKVGTYDQTRCVAVVSDDDFVVVIRLRLTKDNRLRGNFITCYLADNSIVKIRSAPLWESSICRDRLRRR